MGVVIVAVMFATIQIFVAIQANRRFHDQPSLPMQWGLDGRVNWSAPRVVAIWFIPALGCAALALFVGLTLTTSANPGQEGLDVPTLLKAGTIIVAVQALHLVLVARSLGRPGE